MLKKAKNSHKKKGVIFMSFSKMVELLQNKDKGYIILVATGNFYIARGKDAILLHQTLNLKPTCGIQTWNQCQKFGIQTWNQCQPMLINYVKILDTLQ